MRNTIIVAAMSLLLGGCGGGGSGVSGITPAPQAPAPTNNTITDLKASQTFQNDAAGAKLDFDLITQTEISGQIRPNNLTVNYDAQTKSYSVSADGRSQSFSPDNIQSSGNGETIYQKIDGANYNYLSARFESFSSQGIPCGSAGEHTDGGDKRPSG